VLTFTVSPGQLLTKITHDELAELMGGQAAGINLSGKPNGGAYERPAGFG
jgi:signal recognition particle GTPase